MLSVGDLRTLARTCAHALAVCPVSTRPYPFDRLLLHVAHGECAVLCPDCSTDVSDQVREHLTVCARLPL